MKKKLLFVVVLIAGMIATFNMNVVEKDSGDISLLNIEMLSYGETGDETSCLLIGSLDCPVNEVKVYFIW